MDKIIIHHADRKSTIMFINIKHYVEIIEKCNFISKIDL